MFGRAWPTYVTSSSLKSLDKKYSGRTWFSWCACLTDTHSWGRHISGHSGSLSDAPRLGIKMWCPHLRRQRQREGCREAVKHIGSLSLHITTSNQSGTCWQECTLIMCSKKKKKKIESRTQQYLKADKAWVWIHIKDYANIKSSGWSAGVGFCVCI